PDHHDGNPHDSSDKKAHQSHSDQLDKKPAVDSAPAQLEESSPGHKDDNGKKPEHKEKKSDSEKNHSDDSDADNAGSDSDGTTPSSQPPGDVSPAIAPGQQQIVDAPPSAAEVEISFQNNPSEVAVVTEVVMQSAPPAHQPSSNHQAGNTNQSDNQPAKKADSSEYSDEQTATPPVESVTATAAIVVTEHAVIEAKTVSGTSHHPAAEPPSHESALPFEPSQASVGRLDGEHEHAAANPQQFRFEISSPVMPAVVEMNGAPATSRPPSLVASSETPAIPTVESPSISETTGEQQTEQPPTSADQATGIASQASDFIARYSPVDAATVDETIQRFLDSLKAPRLAAGHGGSFWKIGLAGAAIAGGMISAGVLGRKKLLRRVPGLRSLRQYLSGTKID
ncbi:MAG TPA: hypothetical protein VGZ47_18315, partial [Gemmataceae bacterium]|nr:hypothetical protein [Gemmataceae bacterium]